MNYAILLAGGVGHRMNPEGIPKQYIEVNGKPVLVYTLERIESCPLVDRIIIVAAEEWHEPIKRWVSAYHITKYWTLALPGETRQSSILNGLDACTGERICDDDIVVIHDAVRPLVPIELIEMCIQTAAQYGGCMPVLPMKDTVYESKDGTRISALLERRTLFTGQTPEAFRLLGYAKLNRSCSREELNSYQGSSQIAYHYGMEVHTIPGAEVNFKLTTPVDMERFQRICNEV